MGIVGGIGIGTGMAQTSSSSSSIPGTAAGRATAGCVIDGIDISTCTDDFKLNEMVRTKRQNRKIIEHILGAGKEFKEKEKKFGVFVYIRVVCEFCMATALLFGRLLCIARRKSIFKMCVGGK